MSITDLSTEELLQILEEASKKKENFKPKLERNLNVDYFVEQKNIKSGFDKVPNYVIYYAYRNIVKDPFGVTYFFRLFNKIFESYRIGKQRYYLLDKSSFDFSREGLINAERLKNQQKKDKETKGTISLPKKRSKHKT